MAGNRLGRPVTLVGASHAVARPTNEKLIPTRLCIGEEVVDGRDKPGHDGAVDYPPPSFPFSAFKASGCGIAITL